MFAPLRDWPSLWRREIAEPHRVRRYDRSQPRDMRRDTVAGTEPTVAQQAAE